MDSRTPQKQSGPGNATVAPPTRISPYDFGEGRGAVLLALELNRRLLYEPNVGIELEGGIDPVAVQTKIDQLLDRLLDASRQESRQEEAQARARNHD